MTARPYGCHNKPRDLPGYHAPQRRFYPDGSFDMTTKFIPMVMSRDCRYDKKQPRQSLSWLLPRRSR